jgi:cytochrome c peroxidase
VAGPILAHDDGSENDDFRLAPIETLGKMLFFDTDLSEPRGQSCAACHDPATAFVGPISEINAHGAVYPGAIPTRFGNRKPPTSAYASFSPDFYYDMTEGLYIGGMFWDGRALNTVEQAKGPFLNPLEMNNPSMAAVVEKVLQSDYRRLFRQLFFEWMHQGDDDSGYLASLDPMGTGAVDLDAMKSFKHALPPEFVENAYQFIAEAIALYEASHEVNRFSSKYDAYLAGWAELTPQEAWGLELYEGKAMCNACHPSAPGPDGSPPLFTDFTYDNLGVPRNPENPFYTMPPEFNPLGFAYVDYGLGEVLGLPEEMGKMKVPTLRNVGMRPYPGFVQAYMHNGVFKSLHDVVDFYNTRDVGGWPPPEVPENVNVDELGNLGLTDMEVDAIVAFLNTLTDGYMRPCDDDDSDDDSDSGDDARIAGPETALAVAPGNVRPVALTGAAPNPFQATSTLQVSLGEPTALSLAVYDVSGRVVRTILRDETRDAGVHTFVCDGRDDPGRAVSPGVYFYRALSPRGQAVLRVVKLP